MKIKNVVKQCLTFVIHPLVSISLMKQGTHRFYIAPQMSINKIKALKIGNGTEIGKNSRFLFVEEYYGEKYKPSITIGDNVSIGNRFSVLSAAPIVIGNNSLIASDVLITSENHGINPEIADSYAKTPLVASAVSIGNGCWIGEKASILSGVVLGDRCIVGASAVVTHSFPAYSMIVGIPARAIKKYDFETKKWVPCNKYEKDKL